MQSKLHDARLWIAVLKITRKDLAKDQREALAIRLSMVVENQRWALPSEKL